MRETTSTEGQVVSFSNMNVGNTLDIGRIPLSVEEKIDIAQELYQSLMETIKKEIFETVIEEIVETITDNIMETVNDNMMEVLNEETVETVTNNIVETEREEVVETVSDKVAETVSDKVVENVNGSIGEVVNEEIVETVSDKIIETINEENMEKIREEIVETLSDKVVQVKINEIVETVNNNTLEMVSDEVIETVNEQIVETVNKQISEAVCDKIVETVNEEIVEIETDKIVETVNEIVETVNEEIVEIETDKTVETVNEIVETVNEEIVEIENDNIVETVNEEINQFNHQCGICNESFTNSTNLNRHVREIHQTNVPFHKSGVKCSLCNFETIMFKTLVTHLEAEHDVHMITETLCFNSYQQFKDWKEQTEQETNSLFMRKCGIKKKEKSEVSYYYCHRSGKFKSRSKGKRSLKTMGTNKINAACPANMKVTTSAEGKVMVSFTKTHVGHTLDIRRVPLSSEEKREIAKKLCQNVPVKEILDDIKHSIGKTLKRKHLLTRCDVHNIKKEFHLNEENVVLNDAISTLDTWVNKNINLSCQIKKLQHRSESATTMDHEYANATGAVSTEKTASALELGSLVSKQDSLQEGLAKLTNGFTNLCQRVKTTEDCHKMLYLLSYATTCYNNYQESEKTQQNSNPTFVVNKKRIKKPANKNIQPNRLLSPYKKRVRTNSNILYTPSELQQDNIVIISIE